MTYVLPDDFDWRPLSSRLEAADEAVIRLDERVRKNQLAEGWAARLHFHEACASMWAEGELVHLEDVVLADALTNIRLPTHELARAMAVLRARRLLARHAGAWAYSDEGLHDLRERSNTPAHDSGERLADIFGGEWNEDERFAQWRRLARETAQLPAMLAAAVACDAWLALNPFHRDAWLGRQFVAVELQRRNKARNHLPAIGLGLRQAGIRLPSDLRTNLVGRLAEILRAIEAAATFGTKELDRLALAREIMQLRLKDRRASSHLPQLIELFLRCPLVTVPMAARTLNVSGQAANRLIKELAGSVREMTERGRYRAWAIL